MGNICTASRYHHTQRYDDIKNKSKSKTKSGSANKNCNKREVEKGRMSEKVINNRLNCAFYTFKFNIEFCIVAGCNWFLSFNLKR